MNDEQVAAATPRPELVRFFLLDYSLRAGLSHGWCTGGPDGDRIREYDTRLQGMCGHVEPPLTLPTSYLINIDLCAEGYSDDTLAA